jgi:hypothetical protein
MRSTTSPASGSAGRRGADGNPLANHVAEVAYAAHSAARPCQGIGQGTLQTSFRGRLPGHQAYRRTRLERTVPSISDRGRQLRQAVRLELAARRLEFRPARPDPARSVDSDVGRAAPAALLATERGRRVVPALPVRSTDLSAVDEPVPSRPWLGKVRGVPPQQPLLAPRMDAECQRIVYLALIQDRQLRLHYRKRDADGPSVYDTVHPLGVVQRGGMIYLICTFATTTTCAPSRCIGCSRPRHCRSLLARAPGSTSTHTSRPASSVSLPGSRSSCVGCSRGQPASTCMKTRSVPTKHSWATAMAGCTWRRRPRMPFTGVVAARLRG